MQACVLGIGDSGVSKTHGVPPDGTLKKKNTTSLYLQQPKSGESKSNWKPQRGSRGNLNGKGGQESTLGHLIPIINNPKG